MLASNSVPRLSEKVRIVPGLPATKLVLASMFAPQYPPAIPPISNGVAPHAFCVPDVGVAVPRKRSTARDLPVPPKARHPRSRRH